MTCSRRRDLFLFAILTLRLLPFAGATFRKPDPPSQPSYDYVSPQYSVNEMGNCVDGSRVWIYKPAFPKPGGADVIVYMHGFSAARPRMYEGHIEHIAKQGNYVLFPQFQEGYCGSTDRGFLRGIIRRLGKSSPKKWAKTAAESSEDALSSLSPEDYNNVYLFGHSLGGAIGMMFGSLRESFTRPITAAVFSSPQPGGFEAIPRFVTTIFFFAFGDDIDVPAAAPETTFPVAILHAVDDDIAPLDDILPSFDALGSSSKSIYQAHSDSHGHPKLNANHNIVLSGSKRSIDTLDWRYVWTGLDQVVAGEDVSQLSFDLGTWSDGKAVNAVTKYV